MLTPGKFNGLFDRLAQLRHEYDEAVRGRARAERISALANEITALLIQAAHSPQVGTVISSLLQIGKDRMQTMFDEAQLSPCDAAEPARHARKAYDELDGGIVGVRKWACGLRFWWLPIPFRAPLEVRVPPNEIKRQIEFLQRFFEATLKHAELGTVEILRLRDVRVHLGAQHAPAPQPSIRPTDYLIDLPEGPPRSERARARTMRVLLLQIARQLKQATKQGRKTLKRAKIDKDGELMRPAAVTAVLADLNYTLTAGILTCAELRRLASEPSVEEEMRRLAAAPKDPTKDAMDDYPQLPGAT